MPPPSGRNSRSSRWAPGTWSRWRPSRPCFAARRPSPPLHVDKQKPQGANLGAVSFRIGATDPPDPDRLAGEPSGRTPSGVETERSTKRCVYTLEDTFHTTVSPHVPEHGSLMILSDSKPTLPGSRSGRLPSFAGSACPL